MKSPIVLNRKAIWIKIVRGFALENVGLPPKPAKGLRPLTP